MGFECWIIFQKFQKFLAHNFFVKVENQFFFTNIIHGTLEILIGTLDP